MILSFYYFGKNLVTFPAFFCVSYVYLDTFIFHQTSSFRYKVPRVSAIHDLIKHNCAPLGKLGSEYETDIILIFQMISSALWVVSRPEI